MPPNSEDSGIIVLPTEIIKDIFKLCLKALYSSENFSSATQKAKATTSIRERLMQLCKNWKVIVETTPSMWTTILILHRTRFERCINMKKGSILRSYPFPIDIIVCGEP
ncbi:hypothetical protein M422DRAFT_247468 [Sphaerobolus stellatus SS14]|nr:hypothetical protein M422DRAFT_247468 [Sphaerobolus stellatus SS14]